MCMHAVIAEETLFHHTVAFHLEKEWKNCIIKYEC